MLTGGSLALWLCGVVVKLCLSDINVQNVVVMGSNLDSCSCTRKTVLYDFFYVGCIGLASLCFMCR